MSWFCNLFWKKKEYPRPENSVSYETAFSCVNKHVQSEETRANLSKMMGQKQICNTCGDESLPAVFRVETEPRLYTWGWSFTGNSEYSLVRFLDKGSAVKISDETVTLLQQQAKKQPTKHVTTEGQPFYTEGLKDGAAELARVILEQLKESE